MTRFVVDASVALKWCLPFGSEELLSEADDLLRTYKDRKAQLLVPDLFWPELGNALWKAVRRGVIHQSRAERGLDLVRDLDIPIVSSSGLITDALCLAALHGPVYDSLYVVLALQAEADLITADERLANALAARFPVKWLGAF